MTVCFECSATDLIKQLLTTDAQKRLTAAQALEHPWIKNASKAHKGTLTLTRKNLAKHVGARVKVFCCPHPPDPPNKALNPNHSAYTSQALPQI